MKTKVPQSDMVQWVADTSRLLKSALRSHDPEMVATVQERISLRLGPKFAERAVLTTITHFVHFGSGIDKALRGQEST